jgi:hypothetical protein
MMNKVPMTLAVALPVASSLVDAPIFTAPAGSEWEIVEAIESHSVAGSDGSAVTLDLTKTDSGEAPASGDSLLASTFNLKSTANVPVSKTTASGLSTSLPVRTLKAGQSLCMNFTGTLTALAGFSLVVVLRQLRAGTYR